MVISFNENGLQKDFLTILNALNVCKNLIKDDESSAGWNKDEISIFETFISVKQKKEGSKNSLLEQFKNLDGDEESFSAPELAALEAYLSVLTNKKEKGGVSFGRRKNPVEAGASGSKEYLEKCGQKIEEGDAVEYDENGRISKITKKNGKTVNLKYDENGNMKVYTGYGDKKEFKSQQELDDYIKLHFNFSGKLDKNMQVKRDENGNIIEITDPSACGKCCQIDYSIQGRIVITITRRDGVYDNKGGYKESSPLVLDTNKDGKVSAQSGIGVDVDGDGIADGAAVDGDKMLAMSDINGNGQIDGAEVFGDKTVNPFTGKKINAKNGFEALKTIAKDAEKYTGINCFDGSDVNVKNLQKALKMVGRDLGFVSGSNTTELEELKGVKSINVDGYTENDDYGSVQHRQQGSYVDDNDEEQKVDDVWFVTA